MSSRKDLTLAIDDLKSGLLAARSKLAEVEDFASDLKTLLSDLGRSIQAAEDGMANLDELDLAASPATWPRHLHAAIAYLQQYPRVRFSSAKPDPGLNKLATFTRLRDGLLWFRDEDGSESHVPVNCGRTDRETGLAFFRDRFRFSKFGVTVSITYLDGPHAEAQE